MGLVFAVGRPEAEIIDILYFCMFSLQKHEEKCRNEELSRRMLVLY